jgi:hypothetical protein
MVGTTESNPTSSTVNVAGQAFSTTGGVRSTVASNPAATFNRKADDGDVVIFRKDGTTVGSIGGGATFLTIGSGTGNVYFQNGVMAPTASSAGASSNGVIDLGTSSSKFKDLYLSGATKVGSTATEYAEGHIRFKFNGGAYIDQNTVGQSLNFRVSGSSSLDTTAMILNSSGNLLVGRTSTISFGTNTADGAVISPSRLDVSAASVARITQVRNSTGTFDRYYNAGNIVGSITCTTSATAYNTSSDARLKDITGEARGLEVINELNPVAYNWKADGKADEGLIAQEVLDIVPNAVSGSEEDMYQMDYSKLVTPLIKAIQELSDKVDNQQTIIDNLKTRIETLENV